MSRSSSLLLLSLLIVLSLLLAFSAADSSSSSISAASSASSGTGSTVPSPIPATTGSSISSVSTSSISSTSSPSGSAASIPPSTTGSAATGSATFTSISTVPFPTGTGTGTGKPSPPPPGATSARSDVTSTTSASTPTATSNSATPLTGISGGTSAIVPVRPFSSSSSGAALPDYVLVAGEARVGSGLPLSQYADYVYTPTSTAAILDITLTASQGNPGLYINWDRPGRINNSTTWTYRAGPGILSLRITNTSALSCAYTRRVVGVNCTYYISVMSYNSTATGYQNVSLNYVLTASHPGDAVQLISQNVVQDQTLPARVGSTPSVAYFYLRYTFFTYFTPYFSAALTADEGEVDLYVSTRPYPGPDNSMWSSATEGSDIVTVSPAQAGYYYMAVVNNHPYPARYSIVARQYDLTMGSGVWYLSAYLPQVSVAPADWYGFYQFYCDGNWPALQITVDAIKGDPDIYVNPSVANGYMFPNTTKYNETRRTVGSDILTLYNPPTGYIYISIHSAGAESIFRITITGEGRVNPIFAGGTYTATLAANHAMYYAFPVTPAAINYANAQLLISLTARSGNPDLYVSDVWRFPNATHHQWTSILPGLFDSVLLTNRSYGNQRPALHNGTYYIAVHANGSQSSFSLTIVLGNRVVLRDGVTSQYLLGAGGGRVMEVSYDRDQPFHVSLITLVGGPVYVFVSLSENIQPTVPSTYSWSGELNGTNQEVEVSADGCLSVTCRYFIYAWASPRAAPNNLFSIVAHTATTALALTPGAEVTDSTTGAGTYKHYYFELACPNNTVSLFLTALTGNPDLFVRKGDIYPTRQTYDFMSDDVGLANDVITFTQNDAPFRYMNMLGRYSVSVQGTGPTSNRYSLILSVQSQCGSNTWILLENGQPQYGRVLANSWQYYTFYVTSNMWPTSVVFSLSPTDASNPDMYVTKDGRTPSSDIYSWVADAQAGFDDIIAIFNTSTNPSPCIPTLNTPCAYRIAVTSKTASSYTLTASTTGTTVGLLLESSRDGYVSPGRWQHYVVQVTDTYSPLVIIASPLAGNPDLYVQYERPATFDSLTSKTAGVDVITIPQPDAGLYFIGIYGAGTVANYYSIVASQRGIQLRNGRPQNDVLSAGEQRYYVYEFAEPVGLSRPFRLQVDSISFNPQLEVYIRRSQPPTRTNNDGAQLSANGDSMHFFINASDSRWRRTTQWRVLVISRTDNAAFSITASVGAAPMYLSDGRPTDVGEMVPSGEIRYFRLAVVSTLYPVHITVNVVSVGNVTLFVSQTDPLPGGDLPLPLYMNSSDASGAVSVTVSRSILHVGYVYIGVRSESVATRYTVVMSTGLVIMQAGESQAASCTQGALTTGYIVYLPFSSSAMQDITISAVASDVISANYSTPLLLYVTTNTSLVRPTATRNDWAFNLLDWETEYTISQSDPKLQACVARGNCELHVMVGCPAYSGNDIHYRFSVLMGVSYTSVSSQQQYMGRALMVGRDKYYSIALSMSGNDRVPYTIRAEPCTGNLNMYANWLSVGAPSAAHNDAAANAQRSAQTITIWQGLNATNNKVLLDIRGMSTTPTLYQLTTYSGVTWDYLSPSVNNSNNRIWLVSSDGVPDGSIRIYFLPARVPQAVTDGSVQNPGGATGVMKYSVYWSYEPSVSVMFTMCGLNRTNLASTSTPTGSNNLTVTFKVPSDTRRYSVQVVAQYYWRVGTGARAVDTPATEGYMPYQYLVGVAPGSQAIVVPTGPYYDESSSSTGRGPIHPADRYTISRAEKVDIIIIAFAVGVPLTTLLCSVLVFLHLKNQRLAEGDGIEMNQPFSASAAGKGRGGSSTTYNGVTEQEDTSASGYVPPGQPGQHHHMSAAEQYASTSSGYGDTGTYTQPGGGDFGSGGSGGGGGGGGADGGARNWYEQAAVGGGGESDHTGRGFYEL